MTVALAPAYPVQSVASLTTRRTATEHRDRPIRVTYNHAFKWAHCGRHVVEAATGLVLNPRGWPRRLELTDCHGVVSACR